VPLLSEIVEISDRAGRPDVASFVRENGPALAAIPQIQDRGIRLLDAVLHRPSSEVDEQLARLRETIKGGRNEG
jgi:hypothetical protein